MKQRRSGSTVRAFLLSLSCLLWLLALPAAAALEASLDRYSIAMGDTVRLSLRSDDDSDPSEVDLSALERHFEILQRSTNLSTQIINGQRSQTRELTLELTPRREGQIVIPPFEIDGRRSEALSVTVGPEPTVQAADEFVIFEAEVDREEVYVQGQLLLTLRVQQALNLDSRSITDLSIENAYVETLGQNSFQRTINGRPWLVHEIRYAVFPEASGNLVIPEQTFSGRIASGRRTLFDSRPSGRLIRRQSEELVIPVRPRPAAYPDNATWLPSAELTLEEEWSVPLDDLRVGDSVTRTITVTADGLQGAQLPPIEGNSAQGLRAYPDQPLINNVSGDGGVTGIRIDSLALVAVGEGEYELPALEIPWWDTQSDSLQIARLPAQRLSVAANPNAPTANSDETAGSAETQQSGSAGSPGVEAGLWPWIAGFCLLGWLLTSLLWWRNRQAPALVKNEPRKANSLRAVLDACAKNDAPRARRELVAWLRSEGHAGSMGEWMSRHQQPQLTAAIDELEHRLYRDASPTTPWNGQALANALRELPREGLRGKPDEALPTLYLTQS